MAWICSCACTARDDAKGGLEEQSQTRSALVSWWMDNRSARPHSATRLNGARSAAIADQPRGQQWS
jgi:hypothetical protein